MSVTVQRKDSKVVVNRKESSVSINKNTLGTTFSQFNAAGDTGSSSITNNETLTLTGGTGITTSVANDAVTFNVASNVVLDTETINGGNY
jgi:hypothetical protein